MGKEFKKFYAQYGEEARNKFEDICFDIFDSKHPDNVHRIRVDRGDGGIDISIDEKGVYSVVQCKFFTSNLGDSQKSQIRNSFKRALETRGEELNIWSLCLPINLSNEEEIWWRKWKNKMKADFKDTYGKKIKIKLFDENKIIKLLHECNKYDQYFNTIRIGRDFFNENAKTEESIAYERIHPVIGELISGGYYPLHLIERIEDLGDLRASKFFLNNSIIPNLEQVAQILALYGDSGVVKNQQAQKEILNLSYAIIEEYKKIEWNV